ncbi:MAG: uroporphyrinogen decarboxylase family protein [Christensenella sp.]
MTGAERIITALKRQQPDRVPTMEWVLNPDVTEAITGDRDQIKFAKKMGVDAVSVSLNYTKQTIDDKHFMDEWGVTRISYDEYPTPVAYPIKEESDFDGFNVPDPDAEHRFDSIRQALKEAEGEVGVVARVKDVFSQPRDMMGFENFLMSFYLQPELAARLMEMCVEHSSRIGHNLKELGVEAVVIGDDIANNTGLLMRPEMYVEQVYPYFKRLVQNLKAEGLYVIKHSDGDLRAVLPELVDSGIDCLDPIDPLGDMDIAYMKQTYGNRIALKGNIDCVKTLVEKPLMDVRRETARCILDASLFGGHIISSSNSIHKGIKPQNYKYFLEQTHELGVYPLDVAALAKIANDENQQIKLK